MASAAVSYLLPLSRVLDVCGRTSLVLFRRSHRPGVPMSADVSNKKKDSANSCHSAKIKKWSDFGQIVGGKKRFEAGPGICNSIDCDLSLEKDL